MRVALVVMVLKFEKTNQVMVEQVVTLDLALVVEQVVQIMLKVLTVVLVAVVAVVILRAQIILLEARLQMEIMEQWALVLMAVLVVKVNYNINL